jgi:hypothetical protein
VVSRVPNNIPVEDGFIHKPLKLLKENDDDIKNSIPFQIT